MVVIEQSNTQNNELEDEFYNVNKFYNNDEEKGYIDKVINVLQNRSVLLLILNMDLRNNDIIITLLKVNKHLSYM